MQPASWIGKIPPYIPGKSKASVTERYGIAHPIKLASNENPLGPSPKAMEALDAFKNQMHLYPDPEAAALRAAAAAFFRCGPEQIIAGNGSDEIIDMICRCYLEPGSQVVIPGCTFSYYRIASLACGAEIVESAMDGLTISVDDILGQITPKTKIVFVANPNNPTGTCLSEDEIGRLAREVPENVLVVVDEAYAAFVRMKDFSSTIGLIDKIPHVAVTSTLSKSHGLAGLRVGFCMANEAVTSVLSRIKPPFNMNVFALHAGEAALKDTEFLDRTLKNTWEGLDFFYRQLESLGISFVRSQTNFVLVKIGEDVEEVYEELLKRGIITRSMKGFGLNGYLRVTVGLPKENEAFIQSLYEVL